MKDRFKIPTNFLKNFKIALINLIIWQTQYNLAKQIRKQSYFYLEKWETEKAQLEITLSEKH